MTSTIERYLLSVLPENIQATIRAVALYELEQQVGLGNNPSQIIVDNTSVSKRGIDQAQRRVDIRFQDTKMMLQAIREVYDLLQRVTRLQMPAKNAIVARNEFFLYLNGINLGQLPMAFAKIAYPGMLTQDSIIRVVGPLVNYGRKLFWNPVGTSAKMNYYRVRSKRSGFRFLPPKGSSLFYPRFRPYKLSTMRKKANRTGNAAETLRSMLAGATPPGRPENTGQIVKRIIKQNPAYKGLHFTDGWIEYGPAVGWSRLRDPRVPAFGVMMAKKGMLNMDKPALPGGE